MLCMPITTTTTTTTTMLECYESIYISRRAHRSKIGVDVFLGYKLSCNHSHTTCTAGNQTQETTWYQHLRTCVKALCEIYKPMNMSVNITAKVKITTKHMFQINKSSNYI